MSRHDRKVPVDFFRRFTIDACEFASRRAKGLVSILEGGYSDRALFSGAMSHVLGLMESGNPYLEGRIAPTWCDSIPFAEVTLNRIDYAPI
jgi:acetoin utilization deacetylase AcuC-like enzyme